MTPQPKPLPPEVSGSLPILGHSLEFLRDRPNLLRRGYQELGDVFHIKLGSRKGAVLIGPKNHGLFFGETDKALSIAKPYQFLKAMFGEVGFVAPPDVYREQRPIMMELFKGNKMPRYIEVMQYEIRKWLDSLGQEGELELTGEIDALVQNIAGHALMGRDFHETVGREFWDLYRDLSTSVDVLLPPNLPLPKFRRRDRAKRKMEEILKPIIAERRAHPDLHQDFLQSFVDQRYKDGRPVEDEVIVGLLIALMFAGHETTSGQGAWTIIQLLQNPVYRAFVDEEISRCMPIDEPVTPDHMKGMNHLWWALKETERMRPSADLLIRLAEEEIELDDFRIPAGWVVFVVSEVSHFLPDWFAESESYDPLRFSPGREEDKKHRLSLIGFGGGTHKCAGMNFANNEISLITALLLQRFELELLTESPGIKRGMGANRPEETRVRYHRRPEEKLSAPPIQRSHVPVCSYAPDQDSPQGDKCPFHP